MKKLLMIATVLFAVISFSSCKDGYSPMSVSSKSCKIEVECLGYSGENLLADRSFVDNIKIEGQESHSDVKFTVNGNRLGFDADLPDQGDMKWSTDRYSATGISRMTIKFGKQKATLKCLLKYNGNRPPAAPGGTMTLEEVDYNGQTFKRIGGAVTVRIQFNRDGKL